MAGPLPAGNELLCGVHCQLLMRLHTRGACSILLLTQASSTCSMACPQRPSPIGSVSGAALLPGRHMLLLLLAPTLRLEAAFSQGLHAPCIVFGKQWCGRCQSAARVIPLGAPILLPQTTGSRWRSSYGSGAAAAVQRRLDSQA